MFQEPEEDNVTEAKVAEDNEGNHDDDHGEDYGDDHGEDYGEDHGDDYGEDHGGDPGKDRDYNQDDNQDDDKEDNDDDVAPMNEEEEEDDRDPLVTNLVYCVYGEKTSATIEKSFSHALNYLVAHNKGKVPNLEKHEWKRVIYHLYECDLFTGEKSKGFSQKNLELIYKFAKKSGIDLQKFYPRTKKRVAEILSQFARSPTSE